MLINITGHGFSDVEVVTKGWSDDKKYFVTYPNGVKFLLRISEAAK